MLTFHALCIFKVNKYLSYLLVFTPEQQYLLLSTHRHFPFTHSPAFHRKTINTLRSYFTPPTARTCPFLRFDHRAPVGPVPGASRREPACSGSRIVFVAISAYKPFRNRGSFLEELD